MKPLRVCLDARVIDGQVGGVQQVVIGLASGLSKLVDAEEQYFFLTHAGADQWLQPYIKEPCHILPGPPAPRFFRIRELVKSSFPGAQDLWHHLRTLAERQPRSFPASTGIIARANIDVMHFTIQQAFSTSVPNIYQPHDLQHIHFPEFFTSAEYHAREINYRTWCEQANSVATMSRWGKHDLIQNYGLSGDKVIVVPWGSTIAAYPTPAENELTATRRKFNVPESFIFYPAQTWAHKNHMKLLDSMALLRDQYGLTIKLVASGRTNEFYPTIKKHIQKLKLNDQVLFLGFVSPLELRCLYHLCRCLVFPSKFEGWGLPITEAMAIGVPVACSNVTCLPEQLGDAGLMFDPDDPGAIASAILRLWIDEKLRGTLIERGKQRATRYSWERTARVFRAHYRRIAGRQPLGEDRTLLRESLLS